MRALTTTIGLLLAGCGFTLPPDKGQQLDSGGGAADFGRQVDASPADLGAYDDFGHGAGGEGGAGGAGGGPDAGAPDAGGCGAPIDRDAPCDPVADCCAAGLACDPDTAVCRPICRGPAGCDPDAWCDDRLDPPLCRPVVECDPLGAEDPCACDAPGAIGAACAPGADCCGADLRCGRAGAGQPADCRPADCALLADPACPGEAICRALGLDRAARPFGTCVPPFVGAPLDAPCVPDPADLTGDCGPGLLCRPDPFGATRCVTPCAADRPCATGICHAGRCLAGCDPLIGCAPGRCHVINPSAGPAAPMGICVPAGAAAPGDPCRIDREGLDDCDASGTICDPERGACRTLCGGPFGETCSSTEACRIPVGATHGLCDSVGP